METIKHKAVITENVALAPDVYSMRLRGVFTDAPIPGQFVLVCLPDRTKLLGRPFCITDHSGDTLRIVYRAVGGGTRELASMRPGEELFVEGPLGHGYPVPGEGMSAKNIALIGGGLGAPSLLFLAKELSSASVPPEKVRVILGYRDSSLKHFLSEDFVSLGFDTVIATDDGSEGIQGTVIDALDHLETEPDLIFACGPMPMLSAVKKRSMETGSKAYISLEEHMACGVGVCLGCVTKTVKEDPHSHVKNARVCTEGPVFDAEEVEI